MGRASLAYDQRCLSTIGAFNRVSCYRAFSRATESNRTSASGFRFVLGVDKYMFTLTYDLEGNMS